MIEALNNIADKWFNWELAILWQVAVLIAIVWVIDLLIRRWAWPQVRYALWLLVLVKLVLPPGLTSPTSFTAEIPFLAESVVEVQISRPQTAAPPEQIVPGGQPAVGTVPEPVTQYSQTPTQTMPAAAAAALSWKAYAFFVWAAGIAVLSGWLIIRLTGLRREHLKAQHRPNLPERFEELVTAAARKLKLKNTPRVILTNKLSCPAVFGVFRPVLLMPADKLKSLTRQDAEHILLHELAHIKRGDLLIHAVYMTLQIAYWFNPLLWLIRRHLQNIRELCCDATVAGILKEKTPGYRETLLETARQLLAEPVDPGLGLLGLFENSNRLVDRLRWLEKKTWKHQPLRIMTIFVLVCLMAACVLPMAKLDPGPPGLVIKGTVTDAESGQPIAGAKVFDDGYGPAPSWDKIEPDQRCEWGAITNSAGEYSFLTWPEHHTIKVEAPGFKAERKTLYKGHFDLSKKKDVEIFDFALVPAAVATVKQVMEQAESQARLLNHEYIGTEHILLALASENSGTVSEIFKEFGIGRDKVRNEVLRLIKKGNTPVTKGTLPLTPRAELTVNNATHWAKTLNSDAVKPQHVLLGLLQVEDGVWCPGPYESWFKSKKSQEAITSDTIAKDSHNLLMERRDILQKKLQTLEQKSKAGLVDSKELQQAKIDLLRVESELSETPQKRIEILGEIAALYKEQEKRTQLLEDAGRATQNDLDKVKLLRLEAEAELARVKAESVSSYDISQAEILYEQAEEIFHTYNTTEPNEKSVKMTEALDLYNLAYENAPSDSNVAASALVMVGLCYNHLGDDENEIKTYEKAISLFPDEYPATYYYLGAAYQKLGRAGQAINTLKKCLTLCKDRGENSFPYSTARYALMRLGLKTGEIDAIVHHFFATLDNGVTVELVGVCEHPSEGKQWWQPDGILLEKAPYQTTGSKLTHDDGFNDYEFVLRTDSSGDTSFKVQVPGGRHGTYTGAPYDQEGNRVEDLRVYTANQPEDKDSTLVRIGATADKWQTRVVYEPDDNERTYDFDSQSVAFNKPYEDNGDTVLPCTHNLNKPEVEVDIRVVAIKKDGGIWFGSCSGYGGNVLHSSTYQFKSLPLEEIKQF